MKRILAPALAAVAALTVSSPAFAYWEFGHQTVAAIAMANVTPKTRHAVNALLAHAALLDTPECKAGTPYDASTWPDCVKKDARFKNTYAWHYQDVEICQDFTLMPACKDGNCVSAQIERDEKIIADRHVPLKERVLSLVFLIHFVGDLHQPLHAGEREDKGGNDVKAAYGLYDKNGRLNLHSIWDGYLADRAITTGPSLVHRYPAAEKARIAAGSVTDWSRESWQVAHDSVYATATHGDPCGPMPAQAKLSDEDIAKLVPVAKLQVERGGLRLAKVLDKALG